MHDLIRFTSSVQVEGHPSFTREPGRVDIVDYVNSRWFHAKCNPHILSKEIGKHFV